MSSMAEVTAAGTPPKTTAADWVGLGKGLRAQAGCARGGWWAEGKAPSAPDWLGYWTLIGRGAGKTEEFGVAARKGGRPRGS